MVYLLGFQVKSDNEYHDTIWAEREIKRSGYSACHKSLWTRHNESCTKMAAQPTATTNSENNFTPPMPSNEDVVVEPFSDEDIPF